MPSDPAAALSALLRASSIEDHDEILKAANAAIKANKTDFTSQHTRIVALLKLDRFHDVLRAIAEGGTKLEALCVLEKAYAQYKTGQLDEATATLQAAGLTKRSFSHVAAQVAYRAERFDDARNIYSRLFDEAAASGEGEENDLSINLRAASAQSEWLGYSSLSPPPVQDADGFELCYNAACAYIARGSLRTASQLLQRAIRLCDASDDLTDEDKQAEMAPIIAQQAYVTARLGKIDEALELYKSLNPQDLEESDLALIAQNNMLALGPKPDNPYMLHRLFSDISAKDHAAKPFNHQSSILRRNQLVVDLQASKAAGVKATTDAILAQAEHPTSSVDTNIFSVINAAASAQGITGKGLLRKLLAISAKRHSDVGLILSIVQLQLDDGHAGSALSILESFLQRLERLASPSALDTRYCPGLVALAVSLMRSQGRESSAKAELVKAAVHWQERAAGSAVSLLEEAGVELLRSSNPQDLKLAGVSFKKLLDERQDSDVASAGLVAALAPFEPAYVRQYLAKLPPADALIPDIDVSELLQSGVATASKVPQSSKRPAADDAVRKSTKRRRRIRLPKDYEEGKKPDPERWLPLRDRSSYRPKGKKGKKKAGESTQGGMVKEEETLELVGGGGVKVEKAPPSSYKKKKKGKK